MTLRFTETSPGVHMASWENPNSGAFRTVVIIESLEKFTLYIDSDVAARDIASFEQAVKRAEAKLRISRSNRMVQVAGALVVFSMIGGAAVGMGYSLSGTSGIAVAAIQQAASSSAISTPPATKPNTKSRSVVTTISTSEQLKPEAPKAEVPKSPVVTLLNDELDRNAGTAASASARQSVPLTRSATATRSLRPAPTAPVQSEPVEVEATEPEEQSKSRVFSASRPVFDGRRPIGVARKPDRTAATATPQSDTRQPNIRQPELRQPGAQQSPPPNPYVVGNTDTGERNLPPADDVGPLPEETEAPLSGQRPLYSDERPSVDDPSYAAPARRFRDRRRARRNTFVPRTRSRTPGFDGFEPEEVYRRGNASDRAQYGRSRRAYQNLIARNRRDRGFGN